MVEAAVSWEELQALAASEGPVPRDRVDALGKEIARCEVLQAGVLYRQILCIRLFDEGNGWSGWPSLEMWLAHNVGWNYKTANERVRVARALKHLPKIDAAFREGRINYTKTRALHDVATPDNEEELLQLGRGVSGEQLKRLVAPMRQAVKRAKESQQSREARRSVRFSVQPERDVTEVRATLLPDEAAVVRKALEVGLELGIKHKLERAGGAAGTARPEATEGEPLSESAAADQNRSRFGFADALVLMAESFLASPPLQGVPPGRREILIHTVPDLSEGFLENGASLSPETMRRLACDGPTVEILRSPDGAVLDVGRRTRRIGRRMARGLVARDRCCRFPGCTRHAMLDGHHLVHWLDGGATKLSNLLCLCRTHHRWVHEGKWSIRLEADGSIVFVNPKGQEVGPPAALDEVAARDAHEALEADGRERGLEPDPEQLVAHYRCGRIDDIGNAVAVLMRRNGFESDEAGLPRAVRWLLEHGPAN